MFGLELKTFDRDAAAKNKDALPFIGSYLWMRMAIGLLGVLLPVLLVLIDWWFLETRRPIRSSMSAYYHTSSGDLFVGGLFATGLLLLLGLCRPAIIGQAHLLADAEHAQCRQHHLRGRLGIVVFLSQKQQHIHVVARTKLPGGTDHIVHRHGHGPLVWADHPRQRTTCLETVFGKPAACRQRAHAATPDNLLDSLECPCRHYLQALEQQIVWGQGGIGSNVAAQHDNL